MITFIPFEKKKEIFMYVVIKKVLNFYKIEESIP